MRYNDSKREGFLSRRNRLNLLPPRHHLEKKSVVLRFKNLATQKQDALDHDDDQRCRFSGRCGRSSIRQAVPERQDDPFVDNEGHFGFYNGTLGEVQATNASVNSARSDRYES